MDVPYIPAEWGVLRQKAFDKNPDKMDGMSVFGKYLSKMKLNQWNKYSWADTEKL
jgi:type II restriction/modification system DNA methylase subunit YeeA